MPIRPSIRLTALPRMTPLDARLAIAREAGFEGIEARHGDVDPEALRAAAAAAGLVVHSVHCRDNREVPLSSPDPAIRDAAIASILAALDTAHRVGADTLLLIPGMVDRDTSFDQCHARSLDVIRRAILPEAERLDVVLGIENVWNGFLLSPADCVRYIDDFDSPYVKLYLDVGNVLSGHPEGWIDMIGERIVKLHVKDLRHWLDLGRYEFAAVGDGDIDWRQVREALDRCGYSGWAVMAEAEKVQPFATRWAFLLNRLVAERIGANPGFRLAEAALSRRICADAMARFRKYVAPSVSPGSAS